MATFFAPLVGDLTGTDGNDKIIVPPDGVYGGEIDAGAGRDVILVKGSPAFRQIDGGDGIDTLRYNTDYSMDVNLSFGTASLSANVFADPTETNPLVVPSAAIGGVIDQPQIDPVVIDPVVIEPVVDEFVFTDTFTAIEKFVAGNGNDFITAAATGSKIFGRGGNDLLVGQEGNDRLIGGTGDDFIIDGFGKDIMSGGQGSDTFKMTDRDTSTDRIKDFTIGEDILDLTDLSFVSTMEDLEISYRTKKNGSVQTIVEYSADIEAITTGEPPSILYTRKKLVLDGELDLTGDSILFITDIINEGPDVESPPESTVDEGLDYDVTPDVTIDEGFDYEVSPSDMLVV